MSIFKLLIISLGLFLLTEIVASPQATFRTSDQNQPSQTQSFIGRNIVRGTVQISFTPISVTGDIFIVEQQSNNRNGNWNQVATGSTSPINFIISALPGNYSFRIRAKDLSTNTIGAPSNVVTCIIPITPVAIKTNFTKQTN